MGRLVSSSFLPSQHPLYLPPSCSQFCGWFNRPFEDDADDDDDEDADAAPTEAGAGADGTGSGAGAAPKRKKRRRFRDRGRRRVGGNVGDDPGLSAEERALVVSSLHRVLKVRQQTGARVLPSRHPPPLIHLAPSPRSRSSCAA